MLNSLFILIILSLILISTVPPPPPANITFSDLKETRVHIFWDPPELSEMFSIERYFITYKKHGEKIWSNDTINAHQSTNVQLDNLESDTFYIIKVIANNAFGLGKTSNRIEIKTKKVEGMYMYFYSQHQYKSSLIDTIDCYVLEKFMSRLGADLGFLKRESNAEVRSSGGRSP